MASSSGTGPLVLSTTSDARSVLSFPRGFLWGISTAAYQVEGHSQGSNWAEWEAAGKLRCGHRSGAACQWWTDAARDFDIAQSLGVNALRLSVEWSRLEPRPGEWNSEALERYRTMLQELRARDIRPFISLHHFTHPAWFEARGGFLEDEAPHVFEDFVNRVVTRLSDLCSDWVTFNEPNVYATFGYVLGEFPPGSKGQIGAALRAMKNMARAHTLAYHRIHGLQPKAQVGWAQHYAAFEPATRSRLDRFTAHNLHYLFNESFLRTIEDGQLGFPFNLVEGSLEEARGTCDFVGLNVYSRFHVSFNPGIPDQLFADVYVPPHVPQGDSGVDRPYGEAYPAAIRLAVERAAKLQKPIYILENGVPDAGDRIRPWVIVSAVRELHQLLAEGHDIRGYFHWTLTDNFEWSEGWGLRFGLVQLDPINQERTLRKSAYLYRAIARANGLSDEIVEQFVGKPLTL